MVAANGGNSMTDISKTALGEIGVFHAMIASGPVIIQKRDGIEKVLLVKHGDKPVKELKWKNSAAEKSQSAAT